MQAALAQAEIERPAAENAASPLEEPLHRVQQASGASLARQETREPVGIASENPQTALSAEELRVVQAESFALADREAASRR